jgi:hypothetical protein
MPARRHAGAIPPKRIALPSALCIFASARRHSRRAISNKDRFCAHRQDENGYLLSAGNKLAALFAVTGTATSIGSHRATRKSD